MGIGVGERINVFVETADGKVYDLESMATSVEIRYSYDSVTEFTIHGVCTKAILSAQAKDMRTAREWKCTFCGRPNQRADETCKSCGAVRSFIYG